MRVYSFKDVIGNYGTVSMIKSSIRTGTFPNFTLMSGDSGTGKSTCAEIASLALNCENRVDENPCLVCDSCKVNLASLQGKGTSSRVKKLNLGKLNDRKDIDNMINEIFKLEVGYGKSVFILEEVHALDDLNQTALLEEIDKLDNNVYVILCTTRPRKLLEELRNRAIKFNFSSLKSTDSRILLEKLLKEHNYNMNSDVKEVILKESKGNARKIVNLLDFLKNNPCSYADILSFLGEVNPKEINMLLRSSYDSSSYLTFLNELTSDYSLDSLLNAMKKYLLDLQFLANGVSTYYSNTTQDDKRLAQDLGKEVIYKIQTVLHSMNSLVEEPDFMFNMFKIRSIIIKSSSSNSIPMDKAMTSTVLKDSLVGLKDSSSFDSLSGSDSSIVTSTAIENHINAEHKRNMMKSDEIKPLNKLDFNSLKDLLTDES